MRPLVLAAGSISFAFAAVVPTDGLSAQANPAHTHVGHVTSAFPQTPDGQGLLPVALAEARTAQQHAQLAAGDLGNVEGMKLHAGHVLHAVDPGRAEQGPGLGFGVKAAAEGIAQHIELAAGSEGASDNVRTHATHIAASARTVAQRADEIAALIERIDTVQTAEELAPLIQELQTLTGELTTGRDATGDGQISWQEGEGGLDQVEQHVGLLMAGEGMDPPSP